MDLSTGDRHRVAIPGGSAGEPDVRVCLLVPCGMVVLIPAHKAQGGDRFIDRVTARLCCSSYSVLSADAGGLLPGVEPVLLQASPA